MSYHTDAMINDLTDINQPVLGISLHLTTKARAYQDWNTWRRPIACAKMLRHKNWHSAAIIMAMLQNHFLCGKHKQKVCNWIDKNPFILFQLSHRFPTSVSNIWYRSIIPSTDCMDVFLHEHIDLDELNGDAVGYNIIATRPPRYCSVLNGYHVNGVDNLKYSASAHLWYWSAVVSSEQWAVSSEQWAVSSERWAVSSEQWAVSSVQYAGCFVQCPLRSVLLCSVPCIVCLCTVCFVQCAVCRNKIWWEQMWPPPNCRDWQHSYHNKVNVWMMLLLIFVAMLRLLDQVSLWMNDHLIQLLQ